MTAMVEVLVVIAYVALILFAIVAFFRIAHDVRAIRTMLENTGLFSGIPCGWCWMPIPEGAVVCGHCGRDLEQGSQAPSRSADARPGREPRP
jgi:hypothetical protein